MSLKGFHLVFVTVCTLFCLFLALWSFVFNSDTSTLNTASGVIGITGVLLMPIYGICFYRKFTTIHI